MPVIDHPIHKHGARTRSASRRLRVYMPEKLTYQMVFELLEYNNETGVFTWRQKRSNKIKAGDVAGSIGPNGYRFININGFRRSAHRLAWLYVNGRWPLLQVDHINGVRDDNRIKNLREASPSQNQHNTGKQENNKSGIKGVSWRSSSKKWRAQIMAFGKSHHIGYFDSAESAGAAYAEYAARLHKNFARLG